MPVIGFLSTAEPRGYAHLVDGFRAGLAEAGFVEGGNVAIEFRFAEGKFDRLPGLAADLVARKVAVIAPFSDAATRAAIAATAKIPIVFYAGNDPVAQGFVTSLNRPGGNTTGVSFFANNLGGKRLGLLRELLPNARTIVLIVNPNNPSSAAQIKDMQEAALTLGMTVTALNAGNEREIELAFASDMLKGSNAVVIGGCRAQQHAQTVRGAVTTRRDAEHVGAARVRGRRRPAELWGDRQGCRAPDRNLRRPRAEGREACGPASAAGLKVRTGDQPHHRANARAHGTVRPDGNRRRSGGVARPRLRR
ncbi:ABC transporter substrate-binding protein [Rhodoplanes sp. Z2-YC6860]|uniref:ABC transporter substrate-binding protein n=1 Tax=Rhodoplanes sp. Z2-YC6860 TaxID=674703 RepID=UPI0018DBE958|nr:ABC transporter substrate-binding protein [Rhodoplanes sp. Z2-YC6860]